MSYQNFLSRLQQLYQSKKYPPALVKRIKQSDLETILLTILNDLSLKELINNAKPVPAIRLSKEVTGLSRTLCLLRAPNDEYQCILETEDLDANNAICKVEQFDGLVKKGTTAWRLDESHGPCEYASLQVKFSTAKKLNLKTKTFKDAFALRQKEINFAWELPENDYILRSVMGAPFSDNRGSFLTMYAPYGIRLDDLDTKIELNQEQKNQIVSAVLETLVFLQRNGIVHQDIKSANFLIFIEPNGQFNVKLIDFDAVNYAKNKQYQHGLYATVGYESPETAFIMADPNMPDHQEYEDVYQEDGKTFAKICADSIAQTCTAGIHKLKQKAFLQPNHKSDVWAGGIVLYEFLNNGETPNKQPDCPLIKGMLEPDREKRFTAEQARAIWRFELQNRRASTTHIAVNIPSPTTTTQVAVNISSPTRDYLPRFSAQNQGNQPTSYFEKLVATASERFESIVKWFKHA